LPDGRSPILGAALVVGLAPGLLVLSTGFIGRFLLRVAAMLAPKPEKPRPGQITDHDLRLVRANANVSDDLEPDSDRLAVRHHLHSHSPAERLKELVD
jgi:hypothetical protein